MKGIINEDKSEHEFFTFNEFMFFLYEHFNEWGIAEGNVTWQPIVPDGRITIPGMTHLVFIHGDLAVITDGPKESLIKGPPP